MAMGPFYALGPNWSFKEGREVSPEQAEVEWRERTGRICPPPRTRDRESWTAQAQKVFSAVRSAPGHMGRTARKNRQREAHAHRRGPTTTTTTPATASNYGTTGTTGLHMKEPFLFAGKPVGDSNGTPMTLGTAIRILLAECRPPAAEHASRAALWYEEIQRIESEVEGGILNATTPMLAELRHLVSTVPRDHPVASTTILGGLLVAIDRAIDRVINPRQAAPQPEPAPAPEPAPKPEPDRKPLPPEPESEGGDTA